MATNEEIIVKLNKLEERLIKEICEVEEKAVRNDEAIRGNGKDLGLKARVSENSRMIAEIRWYFRGVAAAVIIDFAMRLVNSL